MIALWRPYLKESQLFCWLVKISYYLRRKKNKFIHETAVCPAECWCSQGPEYCMYVLFYCTLIIMTSLFFRWLVNTDTSSRLVNLTCWCICQLISCTNHPSNGRHAYISAQNPHKSEECVYNLSRTDRLLHWHVLVNERNHLTKHQLLDSLVVEWRLRVRNVPGSIPSQRPRHTKDVIKNGTSSSLFWHSTLKREILARSQELK